MILNDSSGTGPDDEATTSEVEADTIGGSPSFTRRPAIVDQRRSPQQAQRPGLTTSGRGRASVLPVVLALLAALGTAACGSNTNPHGNPDCGPGTTDGPVTTRVLRGGPTGGPGSVSQAPHTAPPPTVPPSRPAPTPVNGRVAITAANHGQTVVAPPGTFIDVRLEPVSGAVWTVPESSDPQALPRLSASGACDPVKTATFRADGDGRIEATHPQGDAVAGMVVTVRVSR